MLSLHFHSIAVWRGLNIEAAHVLTQYCIRILWNIYRVKCRHVAKGNKAMPLSSLHRLRILHSVSAGVMPICRFCVFCQLPFFSTEYLVIICFRIHQTFPSQDTRSVLGNNGLLLPVSTIIMMRVSGRGWVLCG